MSGWLVEGLVREAKRPPVCGYEDAFGGAVRLRNADVGLSCVVGVHVYGPHKPARLVGANRKDCRVERTETPRNIGEFGMQACIPREEHPLAAQADDPSCPKSGIAVPGVATGKMLRWSAIDGHAAKCPALPPVHLCDVVRAPSTEKSADPNRCNPLGIRITRDKTPHGYTIEVIVVVMR